MVKKASKTKKKLSLFEESVYQEQFSTSVHFSFKTINSNIREGGIRICPTQDSIDLPFLSLRTTIDQELSTRIIDYTKNTGNIATVFKHLRIAKQGDEKEELDNPAKIISIANKASQGRYELNTESISPRLKQVLLPVGNDNHQEYLSVTPITAGGLLKQVNQVIQQHNLSAKDKKHGYIAQAYLGVGGANKQNVGSLAGEFQRPLFFSAPKEDPDLKFAWRIYYKGMSVKLSHDAMKDYFDWRQSMLLKNGGYMPSNLRTKNAEESHLKNIVNYLLARSRHHQKLLKSYQSKLPNGELINPKLNIVQQGFLDSLMRDYQWRELTANLISQEIANFRFADDKQIGLNQTGIQANAKVIERLLA